MSNSDKVDTDKANVTLTKSDSDAVPSSETKPDAEIIAASSPKPKRRPRINRRSYVVDINLCNHLSTDDKPVEKPSSLNGSGGKNKADSAPKRMISLSGVKSSAANVSDKGKDASNIIVLKKKPITFDIDKKEVTGNVISSSAEPPPKKKHKPITWP